MWCMILRAHRLLRLIFSPNRIGSWVSIWTMNFSWRPPPSPTRQTVAPLALMASSWADLVAMLAVCTASLIAVLALAGLGGCASKPSLYQGGYDPSLGLAVADGHVVLAAAGQAFFSVSVGMTALVAYGAYIRRTTSIPQSAAIIVAVDTLVALLAGLAIFPIIFAFGVEADAGPGLVFITLPIVFAGMPGGAVFGTLFFTLLLFAALTSSIGMIEAAVAWLAERTRLGRTGAAIAVGCVSWSLGVLAALSFNLLADVYPLGGIPIFAGKTFFDLFDFIVVNLMMPIGGILVAVFAGWLMKRQYSLDELYGGRPTPGYTAWRFLVRYLAPLVLVGIFVDMLRQAI